MKINDVVCLPGSECWFVVTGIDDEVRMTELRPLNVVGGTLGKPQYIRKIGTFKSGERASD